MSANSTGNFGLTYEPLRQMSPIQSATSTILNYRGITDTVYDAIYPKALLTTSIAEVKQLLKDANQRLLQQHYEISMIQPVNYTFCQPWLKGFNNQAKAITGSGSGPSYLGFYCGRYWIDQNTKKSFGH
jgi:ABC-type oligopeptide transport system substrate-binding subunit